MGGGLGAWDGAALTEESRASRSPPTRLARPRVVASVLCESTRSLSAMSTCTSRWRHVRKYLVGSWAASLAKPPAAAPQTTAGSMAVKAARMPT